MTFLNPVLLAGLAAVSVPVIIHLLNRHRVRRIRWAAMRFLKVSIERNQRRLRIEDLLLLAVRCLLVLLLALALARPAFPTAAAPPDRGAVTALLLLDNSASMRGTDGVRSRFARARACAETILDSLPANSVVGVWLVSDVVRGLIPEPTRDLNLVRKTLREAGVSDRSTDLLPAMRQAAESLQRRGGTRREIYLLSDGQAWGWRHHAEMVRLMREHQQDIRWQLIFIRDPDRHNLAVTALRLASGLTPVDQPLRFEVEVTNAGQEDAAAVSVRLGINDEPPCDQAVLEHLPAGATRSVSLFGRLPAPGPHTIRAELDSDRMPHDDRRVMAVSATRRLRLLLVDGRSGRDPLETETFYLRHALTPVEAGAEAEFFIEPVVVSPAEWETIRLDDYEGVVLANVTDFSQSAAAALDQYVRRGGGLMVFGGPALNPRFYNDELAGRYGFLPARLGPLKEADSEDRPLRWQAAPYAHAVTALWNDPAAGTLTSARFVKAHTLEPVSNAAVVVSFADGAPGIVERAWGQGRVALWASTASTLWNDLAVRPAWLPLVHRLLGALQQHKQATLTIGVGERFLQVGADETLHKDVLVENGSEPPQLTRVELVDGRPTLITEPIEQAGAYSVSIASEPPVRLRFAAQPDPRESAVEMLSEAELARLGEVAQVHWWQSDAAWKQTVRPDSGREIWRTLLWTVLGLALLETVLGQRFSQPK